MYIKARKRKCAYKKSVKRGKIDGEIHCMYVGRSSKKYRYTTQCDAQEGTFSKSGWGGGGGSRLDLSCIPSNRPPVRNIGEL
jgi:hypothetical protein